MSVNIQEKRQARRRFAKWEWLVMIAVVALVVHGARVYQTRELAKQQEAERKAKELFDSLSDETKDSLAMMGHGFILGMTDPLGPDQPWKLRVKMATLKLEREPKSIEWLQMRAVAYEMLGEWDLHLQDVKAILAIDPNNTDALNARSYYHGEISEYEEAVADAQKVLAKDPGNVKALNNSAWYLAKLGRFEEAGPVAERASALFPGEPTVLDTLGYVQVGRGEYEKAVVSYTEALEADPTSLSSLRGRAVTYRALGQHELSKKDLEAVARVDASYCLHWELENDPGSHVSGDKTTLDSEDD